MMRRWRIVLAGAAMAASLFAGATPALAAPNLEAMSENARCRWVTNEIRKALPDGENLNGEWNRARNAFCKSLGD